MPSTQPDFSHLLLLIEAARSEAQRLGAPAAEIARRLEAAAADARSTSTSGGRPNEGLRPEELTTGNDR